MLLGSGKTWIVFSFRLTSYCTLEVFSHRPLIFPSWVLEKHNNKK
jgi:hypothetical protein